MIRPVGAPVMTTGNPFARASLIASNMEPIQHVNHNFQVPTSLKDVVCNRCILRNTS
jgi:hypothetical protein